MDRQADRTIFRHTQESASPQVQERVEETPGVYVTNETEVDIPLESYIKSKGYPHTAEYFGLSNIYDKLSQTEIDEMKEIELYLEDEIARRDLKPTVSSADEILRSIEEKLNLNENTNTFSRLRKIAIFLKATTNKHKSKWVKVRI